MRTRLRYFLIPIVLSLFNSCMNNDKLTVSIYETSAAGTKLSLIDKSSDNNPEIRLTLLPDKTYQSIIGFGGAFTESSAYLLNEMSNAKRQEIIDAYFSSEGAAYTLTRTHINSCDFSLGNYSYATVENDRNLEHFTIDEDRNDIIPMIKDAMHVSEEGFKIVASPWTAPPWMKDNNSWIGGKLLPEYYDTWALFFSKYLSEYQNEGIDIWGITVENEPLGNGNNWESMHYTPEEMVEFTNNFLGPKLEEDGHEVKILAYDQNRGEELKHWADVIYENEESSKYIDGIAVHWYHSTVDWFPESLNYTHELAPGKMLINTEACVDADVPHWKKDEWYWKKEATDWGWDWAPEEDKINHPKYVPVYRYARNIIGSLNSWVEGWIDWNMVLDRQGGPNWAENWCIAPVIVDPEQDEVYFTPLYYTMAHFSKFIRPGAVRIGFECSDEDLMLTAAENPDGSVVVVILNMETEPKDIGVLLGDKTETIKVDAKALQTIVIENN